jgi:cytochrome c biogenesis protein ResB
VLKLPSLRPQVGIEFTLVPDTQAFVLGAPMLEARNPFLTFRAFRGNLQLTRAQNVFTLEKNGLKRFADGGIGLGQTVELPDGIELSFPELRQYTQFLVARDPGTWLVLAAAILVLLGLLPALYSSHRRVWVRAAREGSGSRVELAGFALQRKLAFEEEFRRLARELLE